MTTPGFLDKVYFLSSVCIDARESVYLNTRACHAWVEIIGKPFTIDELAAKVRAVLDARTK